MFFSIAYFAGKCKDKIKLWIAEYAFKKKGIPFPFLPLDFFLGAWYNFFIIFDGQVGSIKKE